jgi:hypothetical protein
MKAVRIMLIILFSLLVIAALCEEYLLGGFVYNKNSSYYDLLHAPICEYMDSAYCNTAICTAIYDSNPASVYSMLDIMSNRGIQGILEDYIFDPVSNPPAYGGRTISHGNYFRFEAEYCDTTSLTHDDSDKPDKYYYMSSNADSVRVGQFNRDISFSNQFYWQVDNGRSGYAYHDLTYKWPIGYSNEYYRVGQEFQFPYRGQGSYNFLNENTLYVTYAMEITEIDSIPEYTALAAIRFTNKGNTTSHTDSTDVLHYTSDGDSCYVSYITKEKYLNSPTINPNSPIRLITVSFPLRSLLYNSSLEPCRDTPLLAEFKYWDLMLGNLNPTLYWYGHGTLKLDYIEFEDKLHRDFTDNDDVLAAMAQNRSFNLSYLYGYDEPGQGQFESYRRISRYLEDHLPDTLSVISWVHQFNRNAK